MINIKYSTFYLVYFYLVFSFISFSLQLYYFANMFAGEIKLSSAQKQMKLLNLWNCILGRFCCRPWLTTDWLGSKNTSHIIQKATDLMVSIYRQTQFDKSRKLKAVYSGSTKTEWRIHNILPGNWTSETSNKVLGSTSTGKPKRWYCSFCFALVYHTSYFCKQNTWMKSQRRVLTEKYYISPVQSNRRGLDNVTERCGCKALNVLMTGLVFNHFVTLSFLFDKCR